jgi:uncharacterized protein (DUF2345 family)
VLTGFKTQSMDSSQSAGGGYNQLVFDDTPGESRVSLGTTSAPDKSAQSTWLNLGHLIHQADNQRLGKRGHGLELFTTAQGALRAGSGLHISAYAQAGGTQGKVHSLEARDAAGQIEYGQQISQSLLTQAAQHNAGLPATDDKTGKVAGPSQPGIKDLPIVTQQAALLKSISNVASAVGEDGGNGSTPAWENPDIVISAPGGIASSTPMHAIYAAGTSVGLISGQDVNVNAMQDFSTSVESGISLFTFGQVPSGATRPVKTTGMQLHAASGRVSVRANAHQVTAQADGNIKVSSSGSSIKISAPKHLLFAGGGSALRIEPNKITITTAREATYRAANKIFTSPGDASDGASLPLPQSAAVPTGLLEVRHHYVNQVGEQVSPVKQGDYQVIDAQGAVYKGELDGKGFVSVAGLATGAAKVIYGKDPRNPWDGASYFGNEDDIKIEQDDDAKPQGTFDPEEEVDPFDSRLAGTSDADAQTPDDSNPPNESNAKGPSNAQVMKPAGAIAGLAGAQAALSKAVPVVGSAQQALTMAQAVQSGGAQALLAPAVQGATDAAKAAATDSLATGIHSVAGDGPVGAIATKAIHGDLPLSADALKNSLNLPSALPTSKLPAAASAVRKLI